MDNTTNVISKSPERNTEGATVEVVIPAIGEQREMLVQVRTSNDSIRTCSLNPGVSVDEIVIGRDVAIRENEIYWTYEDGPTFKPPFPADRYCPPAQRSLDYYDADVAKFLMGSYTQLNHLPSTGLGGFDVEYIPIEEIINDSRLEDVEVNGRLNLTVKLYMQFSNEEEKWETEAEKEEWLKDYIKFVRHRWEDRYLFRSYKEDWPIVQVFTSIHVKRVEKPGDAHFLLKIVKVRDHREEAMVQHPQGHPFTPGKSYSNDREPFKFSDFQGPNKEPSILYSTDLDKFETNTKAACDGEIGILNKLAPTIAFEDDFQAILTEFKDESQKEHIREFGGFIHLMKDLKPGIMYESSTSPRRQLKDPGKLAEERALAIRKILGEQHIESFWNCEDIESRRDEEQVKLRVYKVELLRDKGYNYCDIVGHEFGHVLGLGEEYYDAKMREQEPDYSHHYSLVRLAFGHRIAEAFTRPEKGQETSSIMSHGKTVRAYHYVTLWEALIRLTEWAGFSPQDWQIVDREE